MEIINNEDHLPDHSSRKGMMSLRDHRFYPAYLLLYGRSIHQYTLQDSHFCSQGSAIISSKIQGEDLAENY
jgi:hypothetical protein